MIFLKVVLRSLSLSYTSAMLEYTGPSVGGSWVPEEPYFPGCCQLCLCTGIWASDFEKIGSLGTDIGLIFVGWVFCSLVSLVLPVVRRM